MEKKIDREGRILVPENIRKAHNLRPGDSVNIYDDGANIVIEPNPAACKLCGTRAALETVGDVKLCPNCITSLNKNMKGGKLNE